MFPLADQPASSRVLWDADSSRWWTQGELDQAVARLADTLAASSTRQLVFCFCQNDLASLIGYLAGLRSSQPTALLDANLNPDLIAPLIDAYQPEWILGLATAPSGYELLEAGLYRRQSPAEAEPMHPDLALMLSTSGSTGSPKFVRLTRRNLEANAASISQALAIHSPDRAVTSLPLHYSFGLSVINTHLSRGATLVLTREPLTSPKFWEAVRTQECTHFAGVPYTYQILRRLDLDKLNVPHLKTLLQAGGKLAPELVLHFHELISRRDGGRLFVMYGQTEATARIAIMPHTETIARPASAGLPIPQGSAFIDTGDAEITAPGVSGELIYRGPNVMLGYATKRADLALGDSLNGRLATGDIAHLDADGYIYITGRAKRDAKVAGLRINLDEVEALLRPKTTASVIYKDNVLHVFCEEPDAATLDRWRLDLAQHLRLHHQSFRFHSIAALPTSSSGKIDYQALAGLIA